MGFKFLKKKKKKFKNDLKYLGSARQPDGGKREERGQYQGNKTTERTSTVLHNIAIKEEKLARSGADLSSFRQGLG